MTNTISRIVHPIPPYYNGDSEILILGSFPSVRSRESCFFYGHPQNRFWRLMAMLFEEEKVPESIEEKKALLMRRRIALWDSIHSCEITGSSDSSIRDVVPNDFTELFRGADIRRIYTNGSASHKIYMKYCYPVNGRAAVQLPSTSPANAAWSLERLAGAWRQILEADGYGG